jgi:hypothetical protein
MSRYHFDVKNGHRLIDPSGLDCRNDQEARNQAVIIARQIAMDAPKSEGRYVAVLNSDREEVSKVPITANPRNIIMEVSKLPGEKKPETDDASHKPAKHIEDTARLASSVEKVKEIGKVRGTETDS